MDSDAEINPLEESFHSINIDTTSTSAQNVDSKSKQKKRKSTIECTHCPFSTMYKSSLKRHCLIKHGDGNTQNKMPRKDTGGNFMCDQCSRHFTTRRGIRLHFLSKHGAGDAPYKCPICAKGYTSTTAYKGHIDKHAGIKHKCSRCGSQYAHLHSLKKHLTGCHKKDHAKNSYKCKECGLCCYDRQALDGHVKALHQNKALYRCGNCGKSFRWRSSKLQHSRRCSNNPINEPVNNLSQQQVWNTPRK